MHIRQRREAERLSNLRACNGVQRREEEACSRAMARGDSRQRGNSPGPPGGRYELRDDMTTVYRDLAREKESKSNATSNNRQNLERTSQ